MSKYDDLIQAFKYGMITYQQLKGVPFHPPIYDEPRKWDEDRVTTLVRERRIDVGMSDSIVCVDDYRLSVQAGRHAHSEPRDDDGPWQKFEVMMENGDVLTRMHATDVLKIIHKHGGVASLLDVASGKPLERLAETSLNMTRALGETDYGLRKRIAESLNGGRRMEEVLFIDHRKEFVQRIPSGRDYWTVCRRDEAPASVHYGTSVPPVKLQEEVFRRVGYVDQKKPSGAFRYVVFAVDGLDKNEAIHRAMRWATPPPMSSDPRYAIDQEKTRLRDEIERLKQRVKAVEGEYHHARSEIERLRKDNKMLRMERGPSAVEKAPVVKKPVEVYCQGDWADETEFE